MAQAAKTALRDERKNYLMEELLKNDPSVYPKVGDLIEGVVIAQDGRQVFVDIGGIASGVVRGTELWDESGEFSKTNIGDLVTATVVSEENERGEFELSFRLAGHQKAWGRLRKLKEDETIIPAKIKEANRGGLIVQVWNTLGFLPVSQLNPEHYPRVEGGDKQKILDTLKSFIGETLNIKIIDLDEKGEKLIVSERAVETGRQRQILSKYKIGDVVSGKVVGVVAFGAFVEFDEGIEGLVHISEIAWQRIDDPRNYLKAGDAIKAKIIGIDESKVSLSIKAMAPDPWEAALSKYTINDLVLGKIEKINPFGLFVELDSDIHGLVHVSELTDNPAEDPAAMMKVGGTYPFRIISLEPRSHRLGLSYKRVPSEVRDKPALLPEYKEKELQAKKITEIPQPQEQPSDSKTNDLKK